MNHPKHHIRLGAIISHQPSSLFPSLVFLFLSSRSFLHFTLTSLICLLSFSRHHPSSRCTAPKSTLLHNSSLLSRHSTPQPHLCYRTKFAKRCAEQNFLLCLSSNNPTFRASIEYSPAPHESLHNQQNPGLRSLFLTAFDPSIASHYPAPPDWPASSSYSCIRSDIADS